MGNLLFWGEKSPAQQDETITITHVINFNPSRILSTLSNVECVHKKATLKAENWQYTYVKLNK